ncbi:iron donor protein CyaY [Escherichia coli]|uniref:iron donor protein CyaY n=1 Tax=Escherichia coli TaxID=562 RepID=UPI00388E6ED0
MLADQLWLTIEKAIWTTGMATCGDIGCEINGGVLTITFENGSKIIINAAGSRCTRVWLATKQGGYHFDLKAMSGCDRSGGNLLGCWNRRRRGSRRVKQSVSAKIACRISSLSGVHHEKYCCNGGVS